MKLLFIKFMYYLIYLLYISHFESLKFYKQKTYLNFRKGNNILFSRSEQYAYEYNNFVNKEFMSLRTGTLHSIAVFTLKVSCTDELNKELQVSIFKAVNSFGINWIPYTIRNFCFQHMCVMGTSIVCKDIKFFTGFFDPLTVYYRV